MARIYDPVQLEHPTLRSFALRAAWIAAAAEANNLDFVLRDLDDRKRAVEPDPRSPGGKGYTGMEALLQYMFDQPMAINAYLTFVKLVLGDPIGHRPLLTLGVLLVIARLPSSRERADGA